MTNVLITGATGFIGRHLVEALTQRGCKVFTVSRRDAKPTTDELYNILHVNNVQLIFHLAGVKSSSWELCTDVNVMYTAQLLTAAKQANVQRMIVIGSAAEYGSQVGPFDEDYPLRPTSPYGYSKAALSMMVKANASESQLELVQLRLFTVYGPLQPDGMFASLLVSHAIQNKPFSMSRGLHRQDSIYIDDAVEALIQAGIVPVRNGDCFNIGSGRDNELREIAQLVWRLAGCSAQLIIGDQPSPIEYLHNTASDIRKAERVLHWKPRTTHAEGYVRYLAWARSRKDQS